MLPYSRPVILLGNGARGCDFTALMELGIPILTSWNAKDLVDNNAPMYFGSPGIYGQRIANKVFHEADMIVALGNRMAIWNVGYEGPRPDQQVCMVDVDAYEVAKFRQADHIAMTVKDWLSRENSIDWDNEWAVQCLRWKDEYPFVESPAHDDTNGYINSYRFMERLQPLLKPDEVIVTDMGSAHICAHQVLRLKPPQRIISSGGLGEMGCGLPMAIGASFARNKGEVLCLAGDGGMMMNLQELQTIIHHQLPIKIIVFNNGGYGMIRQTQEKAGMRLSGVNERTGVSCPSFRHVALAFGFTASEVRTRDDFDRIMPNLRGPCLVEYFMDPAQEFVPRLFYGMVNGEKVYDQFDRMSPHV